MATQEATGVRKYVMSSNSLLTDSSNLGREKLQPLLQQADGDPAQLDERALNQVVDESRLLHRRALESNREVPPESEKANSYLVSALGIRASATGRLQQTAAENPGSFGRTFSSAIEDYRTSDSVTIDHYFPAAGRALEDADRQEDRNYLEEPRAFMDYGALGSGTASGAAATGPIEHGELTNDDARAGRPPGFGEERSW